jgi:hypothetical protein
MIDNFPIASGDFYEVTISASASTSSTLKGKEMLFDAGQASSWIDPQIELDPDFPFSDGITIMVSHNLMSEGSTVEGFTLTVEQDGRETDHVSLDAGPVTIFAELAEEKPNTTYIWHLANGVIEDMDGDITNGIFAFEPASLMPGTYTFEATALHPDLDTPSAEIQLPIGPVPVSEVGHGGLLLLPLAFWLMRKEYRT